MELEITADRVIKVWFAYFWRSLLAGLLAFVIVMSFGFLFALIGLPKGAAIIIIWFIALLAGVAGSIAPFWFMLGRDVGGFRLVLATADEHTSQAQQSSLAKLGQDAYMKRNYEEAIKYFSIAESEAELDDLSKMYQKQAMRRISSNASK